MHSELVFDLLFNIELKNRLENPTKKISNKLQHIFSVIFNNLSIFGIKYYEKHPKDDLYSLFFCIILSNPLSNRFFFVEKISPLKKKGHQILYRILVRKKLAPLRLVQQKAIKIYRVFFILSIENHIKVQALYYSSFGLLHVERLQVIFLRNFEGKGEHHQISEDFF